MFDKKQYLIDKIVMKLNQKSFSSSDLISDVVNVFNELNNIDFVAVHCSDFDNSIISWISFVSMIETLHENGLEINAQNIKNCYQKPQEQKGFESKHTFDESLLVKEDTSEILKRLLSIADQ